MCQSNWRIYRLPGSRRVWHLDAGPDTQVINVFGFRTDCPAISVDIGGESVPRAWIAIPKDKVELHLESGIAIFRDMNRLQARMEKAGLIENNYTQQIEEEDRLEGTFLLIEGIAAQFAARDNDGTPVYEIEQGKFKYADGKDAKNPWELSPSPE